MAAPPNSPGSERDDADAHYARIERLRRDDFVQLERRLDAITRRLDIVEPLVAEVVARRAATRPARARPTPIARPTATSDRHGLPPAWRWLAAAAAGLAVVALAITFAVNGDADDVVSLDRTDARTASIDAPPPAAPAGSTTAQQSAAATPAPPVAAADETPVADAPLPPDPAPAVEEPAAAAPAPAPESTEPEPYEVVWIVAPDDDLNTIATLTGATAAGIAQRNAVSPDEALAPGQLLIVPTPRLPIRWELAEGESLAALAARFDTSLAAIVALNNLSDPDIVPLGRPLIVLPGPGADLGVAQAAAPTD